MMEFIVDNFGNFLYIHSIDSEGTVNGRWWIFDRGRMATLKVRSKMVYKHDLVSITV